MFKRIWILGVAVLLCAFGKKAERLFQISGDAQGTTYHISYWANHPLVSKKEIDALLDQLDHSLSIYKPQSLISKFNASQKGIKIDEHLNKVVQKSIEIYKATSGKFDITVYPLVNAWGFGNKKIDALPDSAQINTIMPCVGSDKLNLNAGQLSKTSPCVKIDVNGIAQGYSVDVVSKFLSSKGVKNYLVEIGGELYASGKKPNGEGMKIGIETPADHFFDDPIIRKVITVSHVAVTTSGNYRKYMENGQQRITHLIDPKTGYPIKNQMISVTVIANDAITADGYDNPLMAMRVQEALEFAKRKQLEAYFIYQKPNGQLSDTATAGFYKLMEIKKTP